MAEAAALLRPREHIVRALTKELLIRRTMTGAEVDEVIMQALAAKAAASERRRRSDLALIAKNAAAFGASMEPLWEARLHWKSLAITLRRHLLLSVLATVYCRVPSGKDRHGTAQPSKANYVWREGRGG
jgi:hypothetical protein